MSDVCERRVAIVTGGSRGIGRAICIALARGGVRVYVNYASRSEAAEETARLCLEAGGEGILLPFNVASSEQVNEAFDRVKSESGRLDILVNNAGMSRDGLVLRLKDSDWDETLAVNLSGAFYCARAAAKLMVRAKTGAIVNLSSVVGEKGNPGQVPYVASKAGLIGMTKSLALELASRGVTVNAVTPGFIDTDMTASLSEGLKEEYLKNIPLGRFGSAEEVAALVVFLSSPEAAYITGQVFGINGGLYM